MIPAKRIFCGTGEDIRDLTSPEGHTFFRPRSPTRFRCPVVQKPVKGFEDEKKYVAHHRNLFNEECEESRSNMRRGIRPVQMGMEDVSTVDYPSCPQEARNSVYRNYNFVRATELTLPIQEYEKEILNKIQLYNTVVIKGETGCGKSTQVPQFILDNAARNNEYANIVVTQPRKMAAIMLATRVAKERDWTKLCSYQIGLDNQTNPDTRITYMTTEVLVQKIIRKKSLSEYTHILLDEVHERDHHTDFALLVVKKLLHTTNDKAKVILMSATIDTTKFSRYFADPSNGYVIPAPVVEIHQVKEVDYKIFYYDNIKQSVSDSPDWVPTEVPELCPSMIKVCMSILSRLDRFENSTEEIGDESRSEFSSKRQGVLVFLPGLRQIEILNDTLRVSKDFMRWDIVPLHSSITRVEQNRALEPPRPGFRKIILTTNIAESSLTIHDVSYVIDFCLTKALYCDRVTNYTSLKLKWASKANCKQRAGRVGRTCPGRVYRLVTKSFFETLEEYGTPELCRTPLSASVLKVKTLNLGEPQALLALALDPPNLSQVHRTILELKQVGALSVKSQGVATAVDGNLTFLGQVASSLPVDVRISKLIVFGYMLGCFKQTIIIAAGLSLRNMFSRPFQCELQAHMGKISFAEESQSDCIAILSAYELWMKFKAEGGSRWSRQKEIIWADKQYLQLNVMTEMTKLIEELTRRLEDHGLTHRTHLATDDSAHLHLMLKMCIAAAFFPYYFKELKLNVTDISKHMLGHDPLTVALISHLPPGNKSFLYEDQLREVFRPCSNDLDFTFSGSRAVIHLMREAKPGAGVTCMTQSRNSTILQMALKMKQIPRMTNDLSVRVIRSATLKERSKQRNTRKVPRELVPAPHVTGWRVYVTHVEDADHFWVANVSNMGSDYNLSVTDVEGIIREQIPYCSRLDPNNVLRKSYCLAPFEEENVGVSYFRARIESVQPCAITAKRTALVFFIDYGNSEEILIKNLKMMPDKLYSIPHLAIECKLCEVGPTLKGNLKKGQWCASAFEYTKDNLQNSIHDCQVYSILNNVVRAIIYVGDESANSVMVNKGWAFKASECEDSKNNHRLRLLATRTEQNLESITAREVDCRRMEDQEHEKYDIILSDQIHKFRGPFTTLEMSFLGVSPAIERYRMTIETNSVNSTALNFDHHSKHPKFVISSFVSLNHSDTMMIASETTLMPSIPGLMQFCLLMFAPTVELRLSEDLTRYSGGLAGLGIENDEIYKDEDIEFSFDFDFGDQELALVNIIRNCLNNCLNDLEERNYHRLSTYQNTLQHSLKKLIVQFRDFKTPESTQKKYQWNCVPAEKIIYATSSTPKEYPDTYPLVNAIKLASHKSPQAVAKQVRDLFQFYHSLYIAKTKLHEEIEEQHCILCDVRMTTYEELHTHIRNREHEKKENRVLGIPT